MLKEITQSPALQVGHVLTTIGLLAAFAGWVVAGDKEQDRDISDTKRGVTEVKTRQEMIINQQQKMGEKQDKTIELLHQIKGRLESR